MNASSTAPNRSTPWHLWVVGVLALLWNSIGAFDYLMTETRNPGYMSSFTAEQLAYFYSFPKWVVATWALGVWGGVLGSALLLLRKRLALPVFGVSLAGTVVTFFYNLVLTNGLEVMGGTEGLVFPAVIIGVAIALFFYARSLAAGRVLR